MEKGWNDGEVIVASALAGVRGEARWAHHWDGSLQGASALSPVGRICLVMPHKTRGPHACRLFIEP